MLENCSDHKRSYSGWKLVTWSDPCHPMEGFHGNFGDKCLVSGEETESIREHVATCVV